MFVFCDTCARAELHQQKRARKLCSATLTGISFISSEETPIEKKPTKKISEQAPGTPENGHVHPSSGYVNVALNLGVV